MAEKSFKFDQSIVFYNQKQIYIGTMQNNSYYPFGSQYPSRTPTDYQMYRIQQIYSYQRMHLPIQNIAPTPYGYRPNTQMQSYYSSFGPHTSPFSSQIPYYGRDGQAFGYVPQHQFRYDASNFVNYQSQHPYSQFLALQQRRTDLDQEKCIIVVSDDSNAQDDKNKTLKIQNSTHESLSKQKLLHQQSLQKNQQIDGILKQGQKKMKSQGRPYFQMNKQKSQIRSTNLNKKQFKKQSKINSTLSSIVQESKNSKIYKNKQTPGKQLEKTKKIVKTNPIKIQQKYKSNFIPIDRPRRNLSKKMPGLQLQSQARHKQPAAKILIGQQYQAELPQFFVDKRDQVVWMQLKKKSLFSRLQKNGQSLISLLQKPSKDENAEQQSMNQ